MIRVVLALNAKGDVNFVKLRRLRKCPAFLYRSSMMGSSSSAHDAKASLGYNPRLLTGERLARMKACAEKASTTFPPAFVNKPQPEDEATTPAGDDALARGRWANERRKPAPRDSGSLAAASRPAAPARSPTTRAAGTGQIPAGFPTAAELDRELGGPDGCDTTASSRKKERSRETVARYFTLCGLHYCNLFANPRMRVLFDTRDPDTAASAMARRGVPGDDEPDRDAKTTCANARETTRRPLPGPRQAHRGDCVARRPLFFLRV